MENRESPAEQVYRIPKGNHRRSQERGVPNKHRVSVE
jgi:hypothetical protein